MTGTDLVIRSSTAWAVVGFAAIAAVASYEHASALAEALRDGLDGSPHPTSAGSWREDKRSLIAS